MLAVTVNNRKRTSRTTGNRHQYKTTDSNSRPKCILACRAPYISA